MPTVTPRSVSSPATMNVAELTRRSPVAARWPSRHAIVIPPAQMPATSAWSAAGDLAGDLDGLLAGGDVGVEVPVALGGRGVAPAHGEVRDRRLHHVLDQAAAGRDVGDVVLVDLRRDGDQRPGRHRLGLRRVLEQLEHLGAVHDLARRHRDVLADPERAGVDRRRHAAVAADVAGHVAQPGQEAGAAGLDGLGQRARVAGQGVGRRQRLDEQRQGEPGPLAALGVEVDLVDHVA